MRKPTPYASLLHDVPYDLVDVEGEFDSCPEYGGLCWPDDPLDKVIGYVSVLDDGFLEELGIGCCSPPPARDEDDGCYSKSGDGMDVDVADVAGALCTVAGDRKRRACDVFDGVPELAPAMTRGVFDTRASAMAGFAAKEALALPLPARAPSRSASTTPTTSSCPSLSPTSMSCPSLSPASSCKTESPEHASVFHPCTVPRKRRCRPAAVRKRPWALVSPMVPASAATHNSHVDGSGNDDKDNEFSYRTNSGGGGNVLRRSAGRHRNRQRQRMCGHCQSSETPQWRAGPDGPGTLCNACGIRYKMGKLYPEYRPSTSPFFSSDEHSNRHRKVVKLREKKLKVMAPGMAVPPVALSADDVLRPCKYKQLAS